MRKISLTILITATIVIITFLLFDDLETYFSNFLGRFSHDRSTYRIISFFILASDIILPVPSSIVMYFNGYVLGIIEGSANSLIALLVGAMIGYYLGKVTSWGLKAKLDYESSNIVKKYGALAILITRGIPIVSESICIVCGYNKMPLIQYIILNTIGDLPLSILYSIFGNIGYDKNCFLLSFCASIIISAIFWFFGKQILKSKQRFD